MSKYCFSEYEKMNTPSHHWGDSIKDKRLINRKSYLRNIGLSVSALALMVGSTMAARADSESQLGIVTQADGKTGTVTLSVPSGASYTLGGSDKDGSGDLSDNDYDKLDNEKLLSHGTTNELNSTPVNYQYITAQTLNIQGGGTLYVGEGSTGIAATTIKNINIENGNVILHLGENYYTDGGPAVSSYERGRNPLLNYKNSKAYNVNMNVSSSGVLSILSQEDNIYDNFNTLSGNGTINITNKEDKYQDGGVL